MVFQIKIHGQTQALVPLTKTDFHLLVIPIPGIWERVPFNRRDFSSFLVEMTALFGQSVISKFYSISNRCSICLTVTLSVVEVFSNFPKKLKPNEISVTLIGNPIQIGHKVKMTQSCINAVISTSARGEISSNIQISPIVEMTRKLKSVIGSVIEVFSAIYIFYIDSVLSKNRFHFNPGGK